MTPVMRKAQQLEIFRSSLAAFTAGITRSAIPSTSVAGPIHPSTRPAPATALSSPLLSSRYSCNLLFRFFPDPLTLRFSSTTTSATSSEEDEVLVISDDGWEDEEDDDSEPQIGDGGDGGGVVLRGVPWGNRTISIAQEVIQLHFGEDMRLFAFKTSPRGYIYVRLDKLSNKYGCPSMEEIENFSYLYKERLDKAGESGEIPHDLALEVSSPGAERLLKVPDDLNRFSNMPMHVSYLEEVSSMESHNHHQQQLKEGVFLLDSIETESGHCVWKLADVKENRDPNAKGRLLSRKQKDWRLKLPFDLLKRVTFYMAF
ncbi:hypothetical protein ACLOJK_021831 [Asimina triloba]